ncbi:MAG: PLP-dependent aminotransferase family protein [Rhodospirillum sp.]|nr:PLP-dependent aminotransferase family protein [Rhodospirillum sp.]MCF8487537.1 PLP-dependent aminotransferase family protein [Rhodospirillum sp.]MCF8499020.1 PLP-dependent aminotransferase family protein [Rhodospirillum sp.]
MDDFRKIAARIAAEIDAGRLRPGDRLPPQRIFAHDQGIAASTAGRVYTELARRGLVTGEVGRGTYIRAEAPRPHPALAEPPGTPVDMETNYPILPGQHRLLAPALALFSSRADVLGTALAATTADGTKAARSAALSALTDGTWRPSPDSLLFAGNGRQAMAAAFAALVPLGGRIGFESLTYPVALATARLLGFTPVPLATDTEGLRPDAVEKAQREAPLHALYLQPTLQNPLGLTMSSQRRAEIAAMIGRLASPTVIEDRVYAFLDQETPPPLAAFAPDHVVVVDSLSKRVAPGLTLGFLSVPDPLRSRVAKALVSGAWTAQGFALDLSTRWLCDGTVRELEMAKRVDARKRNAIARELLNGLSLRSTSAAYHLMLDLPEPWRADGYVRAAERRGIAVTPASAFAVSPGHAPNAIRLALASPPLDILSAALGELASLARQSPGQNTGTEP